MLKISKKWWTLRLGKNTEILFGGASVLSRLPEQKSQCANGCRPKIRSPLPESKTLNPRSPHWPRDSKSFADKSIKGCVVYRPITCFWRFNLLRSLFLQLGLCHVLAQVQQTPANKVWRERRARYQVVSQMKKSRNRQAEQQGPAHYPFLKGN